MRICFSVARRRANKRYFKESKGRFLGRKNLLRTVLEQVVRARCVAYRGRKLRKRDFRSLWIIRIKAAATMRGLRYSQFMHGLGLAGVELNRKSLSQLAIHNPAIFDELVTIAKDALAAKPSPTQA